MGVIGPKFNCTLNVFLATREHLKQFDFQCRKFSNLFGAGNVNGRSQNFKGRFVEAEFLECGHSVSTI